MKQDKYAFDDKDYLVKVNPENQKKIKPTSKKALKELSKKEIKLKEDIFKLSEGFSNKELLRVCAFLINSIRRVK